MPHLLLIIIGISAMQGLVFYYLLRHIWHRRLLVLERDLQQFSEAMCQMAEIQMKSYRKLSGNLGDVEERIMDLTLPSNDSSLPLERRHHVLALARKGIPVEDIVKRLNVPRGEAELILNLKRIVEVGNPKAAKAAGEVKRYAEA
jgi:hypothetical protein